MNTLKGLDQDKSKQEMEERKRCQDIEWKTRGQDLTTNFSYFTIYPGLDLLRNNVDVIPSDIEFKVSLIIQNSTYAFSLQALVVLYSVSQFFINNSLREGLRMEEKEVGLNPYRTFVLQRLQIVKVYQQDCVIFYINFMQLEIVSTLNARA